MAGDQRCPSALIIVALLEMIKGALLQGLVIIAAILKVFKMIITAILKMTRWDLLPVIRCSFVDEKVCYFAGDQRCFLQVFIGAFFCR